ncbi:MULTISPECIES: exodeoxyribonuclease V subunit gamma [Mycobacterium]|uniref:RecBCD enzyme subunit RecC n=1 Tax=Mycobacterium syngnathidarum TaxID=1908205 RepID=A0A1S1JTP8_9MYCO|nr:MULTISPECIES: exodeoxyribonuclease V subunit gamma [Mycobacterium]MCG7610708.1 exodeoxyribonuclease V subunit gamma [Mycobacterium sp. CnD-18-1]OHT93273.1 exodeoxyribonuclease V subunit gamma [Mycobacterium syngnathidarum]OLT88045.1 exodeoxyribonuclease V subunit gamma [Mycobacterium syngnathidarum]
MGFHLHRAERTDLLADGLAGLLSHPPADPFAQELVLVPAKGVERWLSQRLANRLGVCAAVEFRNPRSLIAELTGTADEDPWSADAMAWPLLAVIDENLDQPWCEPVATHLGHFETGDEYELRQGRRYAVARRLAGLFASYARQRPQLLVDWADLPADLAWQKPLWQALVERIDAEPPHLRHAKTLARLADSPSDLPERLSLFGHTRLPVTEIELLIALATHHDLHLWLPHPSDDLWQSLAAHTGPLPRREDNSHRDVGHPLLATLGRDLRELQRGLPATDSDEYLSGADHPDTVLGWLQSDIAANAVRPAGRVPRREDRSVQVHSCHGPARQIEVLREVLLGLLADDPSLEPRDILVMCPDIETYAPLITAGFGLGDVVPSPRGAHFTIGAHPAHKLRVRLADRALVQTNPLLSVAASMLELAGGRATASEVLNLAESDPVRARFGFTDDDLEAITAWVREANIRWGFDQEHRSPYGVEFLHNTWRFGIDRVLAGVAMSDDSHAWLGTTLPLDDVSSNRVELAGRFAEFVERLREAADQLSGVRPLGEWLSALSAGIEALAHSDEDWPAAQVQREFAEVTEAAGAGTTPMRLSDIRALLDRRLAGRPTRANFRTGTLTVCTMVPMRSVPHRVVCLVGLDDGVFPRLGAVDGDDVLARDPRTGERDIRSEDRQLLLDAIGAATQTLVVTYTGANEYSGQARPPAVPLAELLDTLKITAEQPVDVVTAHPLQPFDIRNVTPGALLPEGPFTFDPTALTAAQASAGQRAERPRFFDQRLPAPPAGDVALEDLVTFFKDPVKGFFRALEYTLPWDVDGVSDEMPVDIDALEEWTVGDRMLGDILRGMTPADAQQAEWRRGTLPPGQLGWRRAIALRDRCALLAAEALRHRSADPQAYDVDIDLGAGRRLTGTVSPVFGEHLVSVTYSKLDGKHLLQNWIPLLALAAGHPDRDWSAVCIGRPRRGDTPRVAGLGRPEDPVALLADLVAIYDAGRREPLPLPIKTSYAWAAARHAGDDPEREAGFRWRSGRFPGEDEAPAHVRAWGRGAPLSRLAGLGEYSERLWLPLLDAEGSPR